MSLYRVVCDGIDILDYSSKDLVLLAPDLELEINTAGSLEFVMPPYHKYYDIVQIMTSTIEVYENDEIIWYGRPVEQKIDFFNQKKIYCEGPLSFFNDSVQRPEEYDNVNLYTFFDSVLQKHNDQVHKADRTFLIGNFEVDDSTVYRKLNYESTYDVLQNQCLNTNDGYFFFRRQNGINYIDWLKDMPYTCNQVIRFGLNLLNYSSNFDAGEMATCVLPAGKVNSDTDKALTIADINGGSDILVSEAANTYGRIIKYQSWPDITDAFELMQEGRKYMENTQFNSLIIECSAADLHSKNAELENFRVGQMVHCLSEPHLIDRDFPISKMSLRLDSAAKIITLGIMKRKTLTRIYKNDVEQTQSYEPEQYTPESYNPGVIEDENGDEWELIPPTEDGDPITAQRLPTAIRVARMPNKTEYEAGEELAWSGLVVQAMVNDEIWTNPPKYISGQIPLGELTFSTKKAPKNISEFSVDVMWTYKEKRYHTSLKFNTREAGGWTANYIMMGTGALGTVSDRTYMKTKAGKAIALMREESSSEHWAGPLIISDKRELTEGKFGVTTTMASDSDSAVINGIKFYINHYGAYPGATVSSASVPVYHGSSSGGMEAWIRDILEFAHVQFY